MSDSIVTYHHRHHHYYHYAHHGHDQHHLDVHHCLHTNQVDLEHLTASHLRYSGALDMCLTPACLASASSLVSLCVNLSLCLGKSL